MWRSRKSFGEPRISKPAYLEEMVVLASNGDDSAIRALEGVKG
jgi:hypothetical protein